MAREIIPIPATKTLHHNGRKKQVERKTRVAAYCRVSTDQEEQENSFKNHPYWQGPSVWTHRPLHKP